MLISPMLTEPAVTTEIHTGLRTSWLRAITMVVSIYMLLPAIETHVVLTTVIPAAATASDDIDGASGRIVDSKVRGSLAVNVDGADVVQ